MPPKVSQLKQIGGQLGQFGALPFEQGDVSREALPLEPIDGVNQAIIGGIQLVALRCAGFNNVDLDAAKELEITVLRVPAYSPHAVAEHAVAVIATLDHSQGAEHAHAVVGRGVAQGVERPGDMWVLFAVLAATTAVGLIVYIRFVAPQRAAGDLS